MATVIRVALVIALLALLATGHWVVAIILAPFALVIALVVGKDTKGGQII